MVQDNKRVCNIHSSSVAADALEAVAIEDPPTTKPASWVAVGFCSEISLQSFDSESAVSRGLFLCRMDKFASIEVTFEH